MGNNSFMNDYGMMSGWGFGPLAMLVVFVLTIVAIVWFIRAITTTRSDTRISALEILEERFARGEIDQSEFRNRRNQLES